MMKILITGAKGFIGKNLVYELRNQGHEEIFEYDIDSEVSLLEEYCKKANFVFHLAGINRPKESIEFMNGNYGFTSILLSCLKKHQNTCPVMISSSIQAELENPYGVSKKAGEAILKEYGRDTGAKVLMYRFSNVFGKWCRPNYNSVVATFCYNIARNIDITVNNPDTMLDLIYIDDLLRELIRALDGQENSQGEFCYVEPVYKVRLGELVDYISSFRESRATRTIPNMQEGFEKKLYSTYLSYLSEEDFCYPLRMHADARGSFTEFLRTSDRGQVSVNVSKPGIVKGNHWHHTKNEKFLVVSGRGVVRFRRIDSERIIEYFLSAEKMEVLDVPVGYVHNIENLGDTDMVTIMWANELFDPQKADTYYLEV